MMISSIKVHYARRKNGYNMLLSFMHILNYKQKTLRSKLVGTLGDSQN